eukprot:scaffold65354_cov91-Cyclotella_meneghiniana.AAC.1
MDNTDEVDTLEMKIQELSATSENEEQTASPTTQALQALKRELEILRISRQFKIKPERKEVTVNMRPSRVSSLETTISLQMTMLPVNISTASTGHKLQGRSKDSIIITSWPNFTNNVVFANWEYVVLSRVRTLSGLYLLKPIDKQKSFAPSHELRKFISRAKIYERRLVKNRKTMMKQFRKKYKQ